MGVRSVDKVPSLSIATQQGAAPKVGIAPLTVLKFPWSERTYEDRVPVFGARPAVPALPPASLTTRVLSPVKANP